MRAGSGDKIETTDSYAHSSVPNVCSIYGSPSEACVIMELAIFRGRRCVLYLIVYHKIQQFMQGFFSLSCIAASKLYVL